jgi:Family of unknown function (DUF6459)
MSTTTASSRTASVRWLIESRPPSLTWLRPTLPPSNQPPLDLSDHEIDRAEITRLNDRGVRVSTVRARWAARPRRGLPDAQQWSGALALAVIQTLLGQRSVAQLNRWMVEEVLAAISMSQRRNLKIPGRIALHTALRSVRVQHPGPDVAEVSAHVAIGKQSAALAFRLEALGDRWLCTALELAPPRGFKGLVPRADDRSRGVGSDQTGC